MATLREQLQELRQNNRELIDDNESLGRVFEADDELAAAAAEIKRLNEIVRVQRERIAGLLNEKNEAIRLIKGLQRKLAKLEAGAA